MITSERLPVARYAIIPQFSPETFDYHHDRHFMAYVKKTNDLNGKPNASLESTNGVDAKRFQV
jgi:superoxide dismutase